LWLLIYLSSVASLGRDGLKFLTVEKMNEWKESRAENAAKQIFGLSSGQDPGGK
jgi:hypothetical protein